MHPSPVVLTNQPSDDICVHLIGISGSEKQQPQRSLLPWCRINQKLLAHLSHSLCHFLRLVPKFFLLVSAVQIIILSTEGKWDARNSQNFDPERTREVYRFVTYMLVHANATHMAMNVLIQLFLGAPLELEQGHLRAAAIYLGGGLGGSLGSWVAEPRMVLAGASAGVYAILMAHISHIILNFSDLRYRKVRGATVGALLLADIAHASYHIYTQGNTDPRISLPAHVCGALTGTLWGLFIFKGSSRWTTVIKIISGAILTILYCFAILINMLKKNNHWLHS